MVHTTLQDYKDYAGPEYDTALDARVERNIPIAERALSRKVGVDFYTEGDELLDPDDRSDASKDWIFATCVVTDFLLLYDDPALRADVMGPYKSSRLGDWAFTLRDDMWTPFQDPRIKDIVVEYSNASTRTPIFFMTAVGPAGRAGAETTER